MKINQKVCSQTNIGITTFVLNQVYLPYPSIRTDLHLERVQSLTDHDEPPDGQGEGQPDRDCVDHDAEVSVEQEEGCPCKGKLITEFTNPFSNYKPTLSS